MGELITNDGFLGSINAWDDSGIGWVFNPTICTIAEYGDDYMTIAFSKGGNTIMFNEHVTPIFPNHFDAYFYLLENFKEEEIV